jgi:hypothetical protein
MPDAYQTVSLYPLHSLACSSLKITHCYYEPGSEPRSVSGVFAVLRQIKNHELYHPGEVNLLWSLLRTQNEVDHGYSSQSLWMIGKNFPVLLLWSK